MSSDSKRKKGPSQSAADETAARRRLEELEALEASILDAIPIAVLVLRERSIVFANHAAEDVFGWKPRQLIGKNTRVLYRSDEDYEEIGREFYPVLEKQRTFSREFPCRHRDGRDIVCWVSTSRIGEALHERRIVATYENITERKKAEEVLKESEQRLLAILQGSPTPTFIIDRNHRVIGWNRAMEQLSGIQAKDVLGTDKHWKMFYKEKRPCMADLLIDGTIASAQQMPGFYFDKVVKSEYLDEAYESTECFRIQGKGDRWLRFTAAAIRDSGGRIVGSVETMTDITELKMAEAELRASIGKLQRSMESTIQTIATIVETRDPYTAGHQRQVDRLACAIAREMDLPEDTVNGIHTAAVIHDIGKIYIPAEMLSKPGNLSDIEYVIIKTHPQVGHDILKMIEFPWPVADIVLQHHERMNGSGYPKGLADGEILMEARIIAVADVFESMASHRPYRPTLGKDKAVEELEKNRGSLYDAGVVDACIRLIKEKGYRLEESGKPGMGLEHEPAAGDFREGRVE